MRRHTILPSLSASLLAIALAAAAPPARAISNGGEITDEELALLPPWCNYTQTFRGSAKNNQAYFMYLQRYGGSWSHLHHYCFALAGMLRYEREPIGSQHRPSLMRSALGNIDYVLERSDESFAFWYEVMNRKARILQRGGQLPQAAKVASDAIRSQPGRVDAYATLIDVLLQDNRRADAQRVMADAESKVEDKQRLAQIRSVYKL